jgi:aryl-alcohol dehydrogenase-like predicted oxidoreductase
VAHVGVSNYSLDAWREAERALRQPVVSNQVQFSLASPAPLRDLVPHAESNGRVVIAYSPLGRGLLSGALDGGGTAPGARRMNPLFRGDGPIRAASLLAVVADVAASHGATPAQVALAWLVGNPGVVAIPGARTIEQLEQNAAAGDLELSAEEVARLTYAAEDFAGRG